MLTIIKKKYEIEEDIQLLGENNEELFSFKMQLTSDELKQLEDAMFNKDTIKMANKIKSFENKELSEEEQDNILNMAEEMNNKAENLIEKLCFKENKDKFIELGGEAKFIEMKEVISDYLTNFFMKKRIARTNTINSDLAKITKN
jgi:hypothetical protein